MINFRPLAYKHLTFNSPLSDERAETLVRACSPANAILDIGCGWGELLLRAVAANPYASGIGIDSDNSVLERGKLLVQERGLMARVEFLNADASLIPAQFDLVIALGVTHIWGDTARTLRFLRQRLVPGGKLLLGTGIYLKEPPLQVKEIFGELPAIEELQEIVRTERFEIISADCATLNEWDNFESSWRRGLEESPDPEIRSFAQQRKEEYEKGYRGVLGFCYIVAVKTYETAR